MRPQVGYKEMMLLVYLSKDFDTVKKIKKDVDPLCLELITLLLEREKMLI